MTPDDRVAAVFANQFGVIGFHQAEQAGMGRDQIEYQWRIGRWRRPVRGVYVLAGSPDTPQQRAMIAFLATHDAGAVLSHLTAAAVVGLRRFPSLPHVTVPPMASVRCPAAKVRRGTVSPLDRTRRDGFVLTSASRTLVDCAALLDRPALEELVDAAFCRKLATRESTFRAAMRAGGRRRGAALLRAVVEVWSPQIKPGSVAEVRLLRLLRELGADDAVTQYKVYDPSGAFIGRLDVAVPRFRCGLEYDSPEFHNPRHWDRDEGRYARLQAARWRVDSVTKLDLLPGEPRLRRIVQRWAA